jgi:hypothetical protein
LNKSSVLMLATAALVLASGCESVPEEPQSTTSSSLAEQASGDIPERATPVASVGSPANAVPSQGKESALRTAFGLVDADDQLAVSDPVAAVLGGSMYTGDAAVVLTQATASTVTLAPGASGRRALVQEDSVELVVRVANDGQQLSFTIPLKESESQSLFSMGQLALGESSLASLLGYDGKQQVFRITKLDYKRLDSGLDQITASFGPLEEGATIAVPAPVTFTGTVRLLCLAAAAARQVHTLLDDPMLRSPFCQSKLKPFALQLLAP